MFIHLDILSQKGICIKNVVEVTWQQSNTRFLICNFFLGSWRSSDPWNDHLS